MQNGFHGAKAAVFIGDDLLVYQRDSHVRWPEHWDFPGGGREGGETPFACLRREVDEEFSLKISPSHVLWERAFPSLIEPCRTAWFFVVQLPAAAKADIVLGDEGQRWNVMAPADVAQLPEMVPGLLDRLRLWLQESGHGLI